jgi:hypothetical protein
VLATFEINLAIFLLMAAANVPRGQPAVIVPASAPFLDFGQAFVRTRLRDLVEGRVRLETQSRGKWAITSKCHIN